jgi:hypothetical protein
MVLTECEVETESPLLTLWLVPSATLVVVASLWAWLVMFIFVVESIVLALTPSAMLIEPPSACDTPTEPLIPMPNGAALSVAPPLTPLLQFCACDDTWLVLEATPCVVLVPDEELVVLPTVWAEPCI